MPSALRVLSEPRRAAILRLVWERELPAGEIAAQFDVSFGAVSQHLRVLREAGLVEQRKQGRQRFYRARRAALGPLALALESMWQDGLGELRRLAEEEENDSA